MQIQIRSAKYTENGDIDLEINHPAYGWIPFTATADDPEPHGRAIFESAKDDAQPYTPPPPQPEPVPESVSRFQARAALSNAGYLEQAEALISQADKISQLAWADAQEFRRSSPLVAAIAGQIGITDAELDDLFRDAATIEA